MPVIVVQLLSVAGGILASMLGKMVTAPVIETLVLAGVKVLVGKTSSPVDDAIYREVYKAIKGVEESTKEGVEKK